jgi:HK97 gp10 family phage protein
MVQIVAVMTGFERLNKKLKLLTGPQAKEAIRKASRLAAKPVADAIKQLAPVESGRLKRSIRVRSIRRSRVRIGSRVTTSKLDSVYQGKTFYAAFIEFGRKTGKRKSENRREIKAKPFMKPAAEKSKRKALADYVNGIRRYMQNLGRG